MGTYLNPVADGFQMSRRSQIFVDKSGLIRLTNAGMQTQQRFMCISRPRRFGKSMAMDMLAAYYSCGAESHALFDDLEIASDESYTKHLNQYNVVKMNMQQFLSKTRSVTGMRERIERYLKKEMLREYPAVPYLDEEDPVQMMQDIYRETGRPFVVLIDEWDCLFREYAGDHQAQKEYLDLLRYWLKDQPFIALAYVTGILPVKKYGTHSALNMFTEYSMTEAREMAPYFGFTDSEVRQLCAEHDMNYDEARAWYDGYELTDRTRQGMVRYSMYNPRSVVEAMRSGMYSTYWNQTETYEALKVYIQLNMDGLKDAVVSMLAGNSVAINTGTFENDMTTFATKDDVLTLLIHLGYLSYHWESQTVSIPNKEVSQEYFNAISTMDWHEVARSVEDSRKLLRKMWDGDAAAVAAGIDMAHNEISILRYNDENSLACTINLAFYFAKEYYNIVREMPAGRGYADICLVPRQLHLDKPAAIIELKFDKSACGAIAQIKDKKYVEAFKGYKGKLLLVGINYDRDTKTHDCAIEEVQM